MQLRLPPASGPSSEPLDAVLVEGVLPGPALWKVTGGDHTLWILGTYPLSPKKMQWRSEEVEGLIKQAQEIVTAGDLRFGEAPKSVPSFAQVRDNPDHKSLAEVLDPDVYSRWHTLEEEYIGGSRRIERMRPVWALAELQRHALEKAGLTTESPVWPVINKAAEKYQVKITSPKNKIELQIDPASTLVDQALRLDIDGRDCFASTLDTLKENTELITLRANAWAMGNIAALRRLHQSILPSDCGAQLRNAIALGGVSMDQLQKLNEDVQLARAELRDSWLAAVETSLERNATTFALLPIYDLVNPNGRLQLLRQKGYVIESPEER